MPGVELIHTDNRLPLDLKSYWEDEDYLALGKPEPSTRSQTLIYHHEDNRWWIKVTLIGSISDMLNESEAEQKISKCKRRTDFQNFVKLINYKSLSLLDDTVNEVILEEGIEMADVIEMKGEAKESTNRLTNLARNLRYWDSGRSTESHLSFMQ